MAFWPNANAQRWTARLAAAPLECLMVDDDPDESASARSEQACVLFLDAFVPTDVWRVPTRHTALD